MRSLWSTLALLVVLAPLTSIAVARADAIGRADACPPGSRGQNAHIGSWCIPATCTTTCPPDDELAASCRELRICTEPHEIVTTSPAAMIVGLAADPREIELVLQTCEVGETCDGSGDRAPTAGTPTGPVRCRIERVCARDPLPALSARPGAPVPAPSWVTPPPPPTDAPISTCGCAARRRDGSIGWLAWLAALVLRRLRRWRGAHLAKAAFLASSAVWLVVSAAGAQPPAPWIAYPYPDSLRDPEALACDDDTFFIRSWQGQVAAFGGESWTPIEDVPGHDVGATLVLSDGALFTTVRGGIARYAEDRWERAAAPLGGLYASQLAAFDGHAFAVGRGRIVAWDGAAYVAYDAGTWRDLFAVWGTSAVDLWVAGVVGAALHFDGRGWTAHPLPTEGTVRRLHGTTTRDAWAVVHQPDGVFHFDGSAWTDRSAGLGGRAEAVHVSGDRVIAVGQFGVVEWRDGRWADLHRVTVVDRFGAAPFVDVCITTASIVVAAREESWIRPR